MWSVADRTRLQRAYRARIRVEVVNHYGGKCACCGETELRFLTIDHMNDDGAEHRRKEVGRGWYICPWLIRHGCPPGYQVLCYNCNSGRYFNGGICPHKEATGAVSR